jgi:hypothetical protein
MITYSYGSALVPMEEIVSRAATGEVGKFLTASKSSPAASLAFSTGTVRASELSAGPDFVPVALYKPLRVEIRQVYTGSNPHKFLGIGSKGMLVASAIKGITSYDAAPRAVNYLREDAAQHTAYREVAATNVGTPLVFYTKALTSASTVVTIDDLPELSVAGVSNDVKIVWRGQFDPPVCTGERVSCCGKHRFQDRRRPWEGAF